MIDIVNTLSSQDERINVIHQKNKGVSGARNTGIDNTKSDLVCFVDGDDEVDEHYIEKLFDNYRETNAELVVCGTQLINRHKTSWIKENTSVLTLECLDEDGWNQLFSSWIMNLPVGKLFEMGIIRNNKIRYMEGLCCGEDGVFNFEYLRYCKKISFIEAPLYIYMCFRSNSFHRIWPIEGQIAMFEVKSLLLKEKYGEKSELCKKYQAKKALSNLKGRIEDQAKKCIYDLEEIEHCYLYYWKYIELYIKEESVFDAAAWQWFLENKQNIIEKDFKTLYKKAKKIYAPSVKKRLGRVVRNYFN